MGKDFVERQYDSITLAEKNKNAAKNRASDFGYYSDLLAEMAEDGKKKAQTDPKEQEAKGGEKKADTKEQQKEKRRIAHEEALRFLDGQIQLQDDIVKAKEDDMRKAAEIIKKNPRLAAKEEELRKPHSIERVRAVIESERLKEERAQLVREYEEQV